MYNRTDYSSFIRALFRRLLVNKVDHIFILSIFRDAIDHRPYPLCERRSGNVQTRRVL